MENMNKKEYSKVQQMTKNIDGDQVRTIKILGHTFTVFYIKNYSMNGGTGDMGNLNIATHEIFIDALVAGNKEILLHELIHAVSHYWGLEFDEDTVLKLSEGLYQILKDNNLFFGDCIENI